MVYIAFFHIVDDDVLFDFNSFTELMLFLFKFYRLKGTTQTVSKVVSLWSFSRLISYNVAGDLPSFHLCILECRLVFLQWQLASQYDA